VITVSYCAISLAAVVRGSHSVRWQARKKNNTLRPGSIQNFKNKLKIQRVLPFEKI